MSTFPLHKLDAANRTRHRDTTVSTPFGYNQLPSHQHIPGFELYSTDGMIPDYGPAKSNFYRFSLAIKGSLHVQVGLEHYEMSAGSIMTTIPGQVHAKSNASADIFGYYLFFSPTFLEELVPVLQLGSTFPFLDYAGNQVFRSAPEEAKEMEQLFLQMNTEVQAQKTDREKAVKMYLYLLLLTAKRCYEQENIVESTNSHSHLVSQFHKLVGQHFLTLRQVSDYADLLHITPNHLNRIVKTVTQKTASEAIEEMLAQEAKVLLRTTQLSAAEIAYQLDFSSPSSFSHFFKRATGSTPLEYRSI
jgi:AraC family transcriptional regulator, transcriptional activator of pobA